MSQPAVGMIDGVLDKAETPTGPGLPGKGGFQPGFDPNTDRRGVTVAAESLTGPGMRYGMTLADSAPVTAVA